MIRISSGSITCGQSAWSSRPFCSRSLASPHRDRPRPTPRLLRRTSERIRPKPAFNNPWAFFEEVLGWEAQHVAGSPGGPKLPDDFHVRLPDHDTTLSPTWAVAELGGGDNALAAAGADRGARHRPGCARCARRLGGDAASAVRAAVARDGHIRRAAHHREERTQGWRGPLRAGTAADLRAVG